MSDDKKAIKDYVGFVPAEKYYEILQELILSMLDSRKHRDFNGMLDAFMEIYLLSFSYIEKFMTKQDFELFLL